MTTAEQAEVELANRQGRLHHSQRGKVLDATFWLSLVFAIAGLGTAVTLALAAETTAEVLGTVVPILALAAWLAFLCGRRLADLRAGRLIVVTGWTRDFGRQRPDPGCPIALSVRLSKGMNEHYYLTAGGKEFQLYSKELRARIQPERTNSVYLTPRTKLLINVLPA